MQDIKIVKSSNITSLSNATEGAEINYTFKVTNTGTLPLNDIQVEDPKISDIQGPQKNNGNTDNVLNVGEEWVYTGTYNVSASDISEGKVDNIATVMMVIVITHISS